MRRGSRQIHVAPQSQVSELIHTKSSESNSMYINLNVMKALYEPPARLNDSFED